jgi:hypothetical protein
MPSSLNNSDVQPPIYVWLYVRGIERERGRGREGERERKRDRWRIHIENC